MDKIDRPEATQLLSRQVSGGRYFFLNLAPVRQARLAVIMGGREQCNPDYMIDRRGFRYHVLECVIAGKGDARLDGRRHALGPGVVFAYAPTTRVVMRTDPAQPMVKYFLCFNGTAGPARLRRCGVPLGTFRQLAAPGEITSVLEDLVREGQRSSAQAALICATLLELLLLKIEDAFSLAGHASEPAREAFLRCKALIDAEAERLGTLEEIARAARVEAWSICRWFRRYQGTSPYQYLLRRKMNLAAEHLVEAGGLVKEVAQRVGFADPYHFSRVFKAVHGVSPKALLRYRSMPSGEKKAPPSE